jgi:predicted AAA+ superfamily ATPase
MAVAIEVKGSSRVHDGDLRALRSLGDEFRVRSCLVVCTETEPRRVSGGIEVLPWQDFLERLWSGELTKRL